MQATMGVLVSGTLGKRMLLNIWKRSSPSPRLPCPKQEMKSIAEASTTRFMCGTYERKPSRTQCMATRIPSHPSRFRRTRKHFYLMPTTRRCAHGISGLLRLQTGTCERSTGLPLDWKRISFGPAGIRQVKRLLREAVTGAWSCGTPSPESSYTSFLATKARSMMCGSRQTMSP